MKELFQAITFLIAFIGILFAAHLTARIVGSKFANYGRSKYIRIIDRIILGKDKWVCIIQIGKQYYFVGVTSQNIELLGRIQEQELIPLYTEKEAISFPDVLGDYMRKWFKGGMDEDN